MPVFSIQHITQYLYDRPVKESTSHVRIFPVQDDLQQVLQQELLITGSPAVDVYIDYFGNRVGDFSFLPPHQELKIDSRIVVRTNDEWSAPLLNTATVADVLPLVENDIALLWLCERERIEKQAQFDALIDSLELREGPIVQIASACNAYIYKHFQYQKGITNVETTLDEILEHRSGVCQDFAHLLLQMLRTLGIPARYVSGYICPNKSGMRGEGATHAWVEYFLPGEGWVGLDPTNNIFAGTHHVRLAVGRHFGDCSPVKGTFKGIANQKLSVYVSVGYEDGHTFENTNNVLQDGIAEAGAPEPWQYDWMAAQQQQQQ